MAQKGLMDKLKFSESYISMALGLIVVVVIGVLLFNYFSGQKPGLEEEGVKEGVVTDEATGEEVKELPTNHTVAPGEDLWKIAKRYFNSGYNWVDIGQANELVNPNHIESGMVLTIPKVETRKPEVVVAATPVSEGETYTVVRGDNLWNIAQKVYGDGFTWVKIAQANNLANPNLIHIGNVFVIPR